MMQIDNDISFFLLNNFDYDLGKQLFRQQISDVASAWSGQSHVVKMFWSRVDKFSDWFIF